MWLELQAQRISGLTLVLVGRERFADLIPEIGKVRSETGIGL